MDHLRPLMLATAVATAGIAAGLDTALACACCSFTAQRVDTVRKIDGEITAQLEQMNFRREARLSVGERYEDAIPGIDDPSFDFTVTVTRLEDRITFALRDAKGRSGTLSLVQPQTISVFMVDPRSGPDHGLGPTLYKEWRITTAVAADGLFHASGGPGRRITLVMHGQGNSCTDAEDFRHWSLIVSGGDMLGFTLYGALTTGAVQ
jgi:hypothetical protein